MKQYWEWTATDKNGKSRIYQTEGYDVSEATMLEFLRTSFIGLKFGGIKRIRQGECKQRTGEVQTHAFQFGIMEAVIRELNGRSPRSLFADSSLSGVVPINKKPIKASSILSDFKPIKAALR